MVIVGSWSVVRHWSRVGHFVVQRSRFVDDRVETVMIVGGVVNCAHRTVRLDQRVLTLDYVTVPSFGLGFDVAGVGVFDAIVERVFWIGLYVKGKSPNDQNVSKDLVRTILTTGSGAMCLTTGAW
jgi:hypothetical protein